MRIEMTRRDADIIGYMYNDTEQKIREQIAKEIEAIHPDTSWTYDADIVKVVEEAAAIARGKNANI
jgi:hypothetical protein